MSEGENEERERVSDEAARGEAEEATSAHTASASRPGDHDGDHDGDQAVNEAELKAQGADADADAGEGAEKHEDGEELTDSQDSFERGSSAELASSEAEDGDAPQSDESGAESRLPEEGDDQDSNDAEQRQEIDEKIDEKIDEEIDQDAEDENATLPGDDDEARGPGLEPALHLEPEQRKSVIESVIFVADKPITERQIAQKLGLETEEVRRAVEELVEEYSERGIRLDRISGGLLFRTAAANAPFVRKMKAPPPVRMTRAQLETLSIVAYRQPVTRPEVDEIRGVDSGSALKVLADRELVRILGRKEEPGRPLLYGTTTFFLEFFGLNSLRDLPTLKEFSDLSEESRSLFERRMGEPIDMRAIREEAEAAEAAMQDELLQQFPDDENDDVDEREEDAPAEEQGDEREAEEAAPAISPERAIRDSIDDAENDELDDDELDDDELDDDELDDDELDDDELDDDELDDDELDDDELDDDELDDDELDDDELDDDERDDEDDNDDEWDDEDDNDDEWDDEDDDDDEWDEDDELDDDERDDGDGAQDELDDRRDAGQEEQEEHGEQEAVDEPEPPEGDDDLPRDDSGSSTSLSDDFDDDDFEDDDPDDDVFENPDFDDDEDWEDEEDDDDWEDDDEEDEE